MTLRKTATSDHAQLTVFLTVSRLSAIRINHIIQLDREDNALLPKETNWPGRRRPGLFLCFKSL